MKVKLDSKEYAQLYSIFLTAQQLVNHPKDVTTKDEDWLLEVKMKRLKETVEEFKKHDWK